MMRSTFTAGAVALGLLATPAKADDDKGWIDISNGYSDQVLRLQAKYGPEGAANTGVEGYDDQIFQISQQITERSRADARALAAKLTQARDAADHPKVRQDLGILIQTLNDRVESSELNEQYMLPYFNLAQGLYFGFQGLLDPQNNSARYPAALERLRKYAGLADGFEAITEQAKHRISDGLKDPKLIGPYVGQLDDHIANAPRFIAGIRQVLTRSGLEGWESDYDVLAKQLQDYYAWLDQNVRPRARPEPMAPAAIYADNLKNYGVTLSPEELIQRAELAFANIQNEMKALAPLVAADRGFAQTDYRSVIRRLQQEQIPGDQVIDAYTQALKTLEGIIVREGLVTLPKREAGIEVGSEAETAAIPAPHLRPPRLIGNTGQYPIFIVPYIKQNEDGSWANNADNFRAGALTVTAHEARPGHELQFSAMIENGVSTARALFAFNSANVEGWGLYAEAIAKPYMPLDAQLISLQWRLVRAARMMLDPMVNLGRITPAEAKRVLMEDVGLQDGIAQQEADRYAFRGPGQATSYYFGYSNLQALRTEVELKLRDKFDQRAYHNFLLAQGLLPPAILRQAVMEEFVAPQLKEKS